ncbi:MAG: hypothetical protein QXD48_01950 [Candidatus Aenigmatarchaeota archaeon]
MKGFIRILEAIIASIIILASLTYFFKLDVIESEWSDANILIQSKDVIASLYKNNTLISLIKDNNKDGLNNELTKIFLRTVDFSITIKGIPNPEIFIGCNCTNDEINRLKSILNPLNFTYKNKKINILIQNESIENIHEETNILFIFGYKNMTPYKTKLYDFLNRGGAIFVFADLTKNQVNDGIFNETFGLSWNDSLSTSSSGIFYDTMDPDKPSYNIAKYFVNISGMSDNTIFSNFNNMNKISIDNRTIIISSNLKSSLVKINKNIIKGNGRTVWFSNYINNEAINNLTKATIMWASGENYKMDLYKKILPSKYEKISYILFDEDVYELILTVWTIY